MCTCTQVKMTGVRRAARLLLSQAVGLSIVRASSSSASSSASAPDSLSFEFTLPPGLVWVWVYVCLSVWYLGVVFVRVGVDAASLNNSTA